MNETPDMNDAFIELNKAFDTSFKEEYVESKEKLESLPKLIQNTQTAKDGDIQLENKEYIKTELLTLISSNYRIMNILEQDIKVGQKPRYHEVYAILSRSVLDAVKELKELGVAEQRLNIEHKKLGLKTEAINSLGQMSKNMILGGRQLLDMIEHAKKESQLNSVEAEYYTVDDEKRNRDRQENSDKEKSE